MDDTPLEAIASYRKLLSLYPNDEDGIVLLGSVYRNLEEWDLAAEQFEKAFQIYPKSELGFENLAFVYMSEGLYDRARALLEANEHLFPGSTIIPYSLSLIFLYQNNFDRALQELNNWVSMAPESAGALEHMANIYSIRGEFDLAKKLYFQLLAKDDPEAQRRGRAGMILLDLTRGELEKCSQEVRWSIELAQKTNNNSAVINLRLVQAYINLQSGRFAEAVETANMVGQTVPDLITKECALHYQGLAFLGWNRIKDAKKAAQQLSQLIERSGCPKHKRQYYHLMGCIAAKEGIPAEAIKYFETAISLLPQQVDKYDEHAFYLDPLARALYQTGNFEAAQEQYEKIVSLTTGRLCWGDIYARSFYWLGKIQQKKGSRAKAAEYYKRFLILWENADQTFPEKEDAKSQLALLE
jgi:tetratricopeptide (TPR) repeat protein